MSNVRDPKPIKVGGKITKHRTPKVPQAHLTSGVAIAARAPTVREQHKATGITVPDSDLRVPGLGPEWDRKVRGYDWEAKGYVARAIAEPEIIGKVNHNVGTTPELVVLGYFLSRGYELGKTLLFQQTILRSPDTGFRRIRRKFVVDISVIDRGGRIVDLPVDGAAWHSRLLSQELKDAARNRELGQHQKVVVIPERVTYHGADLRTYLEMHDVY